MDTVNNNDVAKFESIAGINFSPKEMLVIHELVIGESYKVIAMRLSMSERTIQYHIKNIMNKVGCNSKSDLMAFFNKNGIFPDDKYQNYIRKSEEKYRRWKLYIGVASVITAVISFHIYNVHNKNENIAIIDLPRFHENFLKRANLLSQIKKILEIQSGIKTVVIIGGGGAGKTTLAREFLAIVECPIKWEINAETGDSIYNSFLDLADHLADTEKHQKKLKIIKDLNNLDEKRKRLIQFVSALLRNHKNWCLIFDNVEEMKHVNRYLPQSSQYWGAGTVIITSRNEGIKNTGYTKSSWVVGVGFLSKTEQRKLFCDILYGTEFEDLSPALQAKVENFLLNVPKMPLDVCAAAYYLKNTQISLEDYEKIMATACKDLNEAQSVLLEENVNYNKTRYSIISSVFEEILRENPKFKALLLIICLMNSQNIPKNLIRTCSDSITADKFIYELRKDSLISGDKDSLSMHRSSQSIGLDYIQNVLNFDEKKQILENLISILTPYKKLEQTHYNLIKMIPHLESVLTKISGLKLQDSVLQKSKISLFLTLANIFRYNASRIKDSLDYFKKSLELNESCEYLDSNAVVSINLKIGEIYTLMSENNAAFEYLKKSMEFLPDNPVKLSKCYRLLGIIYMRKDQFFEANEHFEKAIATLDQQQSNDTNIQERKSDIYADMAFNYHMNGINRDDASKSVEMMQKAIAVLASVEAHQHSNYRLTERLAIHISRLAGIYNALGKYDPALQTAQRAEDIITKISVDSSVLYAQGIIAREKGLAHLRLNKVKEAYDYFMQAKKIFSQICDEAYLFRLKMHEAESLIRLNHLNEAFDACQSMFSLKDRERNNYCDLFFNTCYYHAAIIKYRQNDIKSAQKYFRDFFSSMRILCGNILPREKYGDLIKQNVFDESPHNIKTCFENSLKIFEAIYWKDYEFTKYYVEENFKSMH